MDTTTNINNNHNTNNQWSEFLQTLITTIQKQNIKIKKDDSKFFDIYTKEIQIIHRNNKYNTQATLQYLNKNIKKVLKKVISKLK